MAQPPETPEQVYLAKLEKIVKVAVKPDFDKVNVRFDKVDGRLDSIDTKLASVVETLKLMQQKLG